MEERESQRTCLFINVSDAFAHRERHRETVSKRVRE